MTLRLRADSALVLCLAALAFPPASGAVNARLLRFPDISQSQVAFTYAGDVWLAPKEGGVAQRLSTPPGQEVFARFSPDGKLLAYSGSYDGNLDVYVVPVAGG